MKRIFIAVKTEPGGDLIRMITSVRAMLGTENIKWVDLSGIHITLAFLGDTAEERIKVLDRMLRERCGGFGEFDFILSGAGVFKSFTDPRALWVGIAQTERLSSLYEIIAEGMGGAGFEIEDRKFRPHLTIGRVKSVSNPARLRSAIEKYKGVEFQTVKVKEIILYESILKKTGPLYIPLGKYPL
ncbi:MAG: RNA 2',3'-cyclic phosphodiesterase [Bacteroidales bacterium]